MQKVIFRREFLVLMALLVGISAISAVQALAVDYPTSAFTHCDIGGPWGWKDQISICPQDTAKVVGHCPAGSFEYWRDNALVGCYYLGAKQGGSPNACWNFNHDQNDECCFFSCKPNPFTISDIITKPESPIILYEGINEHVNITFKSSRYPLYATFYLRNEAGDVLKTKGPITVSDESSLPLHFGIPANLSSGDYRIKMVLSDDYGNNASLRAAYITIKNPIYDTTPPTYSDILIAPESPQPYAADALYKFRVKWFDESGIDTALLYIDGSPYKMDQGLQYFKFTVSPLLAGTHTYSFWANDTRGNSDQSPSFNYIVTKSISSCSIQLSSTKVTYPDKVTVSAICSNPESPLVLTRNGVVVTQENNVPMLLQPGNYTYIASTPQTTNYAAATQTATLVIQPRNQTCTQNCTTQHPSTTSHATHTSSSTPIRIRQNSTDEGIIYLNEAQAVRASDFSDSDTLYLKSSSQISEDAKESFPLFIIVLIGFACIVVLVLIIIVAAIKR